MDHVGNVGGEKIKGEIFITGRWNVASFVIEANVSVTTFNHLLPVTMHHLKGTERVSQLHGSNK